jgi:DNA-binding MarR family transcriptional regulator
MRELVLDNERRKEVSRALDLSFNRVKALLRVAEAPLAMRELSTVLGIDAPYTTVVVDDLERRGLVERSVSSRDRRAKVVRATTKGRSSAHHAKSILERPPGELSSLTHEDLGYLHDILAAMITHRQTPRSTRGDDRMP